MENDIKEELLEEYMIVETLVRDNPCGMSVGILQSLKNVLNDFIGKHCVEGATREQVAKYYGVDVRTLSRWKKDYPDFPESRMQGRKENAYNWMDVIRWKRKHSDLFAE